MRLDNVLYSDPCGLEALAPEWWDLLERSELATPTLTPTWLVSWWRVFGGSDGRSLRLLAMRSRGTLVGLAPFLSRSYWYTPAVRAEPHGARRGLRIPMPGLRFLRLEPLGSGEPEQDEICSDYLGLIAARGFEASVAEAFADALGRGELGPIDEVVLPRMDGAAPVTLALRTTLEQLGWEIETIHSLSSPYIELPATFDEYLGKLPSSARYLITRSLRDFEKWAGRDARWTRASDMSDLERGSLVLRRLHAERWNAEGAGGAFESRKFSLFHDLAMPNLLRRGALDLHWLEVREVPIAALYNIVWRGRLSFYQSGRKMDLPKRLRPGIVIHAHAIRNAIDAGLREYDFLPGSQPYKLQLATALRPVVGLRAARKSLRERARRGIAAGLARWRANRAAAEEATKKTG